MAKPCIAHVHDKIRGAVLALGHVTRHKQVGVACSSYMASSLRSGLGPSSTTDPWLLLGNISEDLSGETVEKATKSRSSKTNSHVVPLGC